MNLGKGTGEKEKRSNAESSVEELSKEEIAEIKEQISIDYRSKSERY